MSTISASNIQIPTSFPHSLLDANGSNYTSWVMAMDLRLSLFNLWRLLTGDEKGPQHPSKSPTESDNDFNKCLTTHDASVDIVSFQECQSITKGLLSMAVHSSDLIHFTGATDPATIWKALEDKYQVSVSIHFMSLMGHVFDLHQQITLPLWALYSSVQKGPSCGQPFFGASDSDSLTNTIKEITDIKAQFKVIKSVEWKCNEYTLVQALLRALPDFYVLLSQLIPHTSVISLHRTPALDVPKGCRIMASQSSASACRTSAGWCTI
ncbi:uncharacterized protein BJ212DRAFT_1484484 [Suillus subaureus]|uniref:DUF4219 domain-containing protein n=1 Tax=Suillus subaureus TaxID=48587 RepID=A0A9P7E2N6_9AGAM|nr:uncharacterized protein BJ212DRAFT_1484484 [Suillus subaureus]KAG1809364.1 hypothetical protein BJ212DRAFT_1484484 [Suillus subaureus]